MWHDGGSTEAQELGFTLATAVAYLRSLDRLDEEALARAVGITLAADQDMFLTLAKFRAIRLLWGQVCSECSLPPVPLRLHAETSWRMMTKRDPYSNILRAAAAVFGAGLGGADSIAVLPFSAAQELPDRFARRIARNTQSILLEESNLLRAADPAGGSGYVEHLTQSLSGQAWSIFQGIEKANGIMAALELGFAATDDAEARAHRTANPGIIIGTTDFVAPMETRFINRERNCRFPLRERNQQRRSIRSLSGVSRKVSRRNLHESSSHARKTSLPHPFPRSGEREGPIAKQWGG